MLVIQLCLLLLPFGVSSAVSAKPNNKFTCAVTKANDADDLRKCVAKDLLLGWLYVINKTSVRLDEVRKNATAMAEGAKELRKEANAALNSAANVLIGLGSNSNEALGVKEIMKNISDAITWVNESERNASEAADVTDITEGLTEVGYAAISRVHWYFRDKFKYVQEHWADKGPSEVVETIFPATLQCPNMINVSKTLSDYADKLDDSTIRLDAWRVEMLKKIQTTHNDTQGNGTTCHSIFNNRDRMHEVMGAVANLSDRLIVVVRKLHAALLVREKARANVDAANENMKTMTTSMLNSLKQNGTALCEMLRQHAAIRSKLSEAYRKLEEVSGRVSNNLASATNTEKTAAARSVLVHSVLKEVEGLSRSTILFNSAESPTLRNATQANEKMKNAVKRSVKAVELFDKVGSAVVKAEKDADGKYKKLEEINNNLRERLGEIGIGIDITDNDECNGELLNKVGTSTKEFLRLAAKLNVSELRKANKTLRELEARAEEINKNVSSVSKDLEVAVQNLKNVNELMRNSSVAAEYVVADVLSHLMSELCATAAELRVTRKNLTLLSANATSIKKSVSEEEAQAIAALKNASGSPDTSPYVEEGFTVAVRMTALLEKELQRTNARLEMMTASRAAMKLKEVHAGNTNVFDAVSDAVVGIFADTPGKPHENVCTRNGISELVQKLKGKSDDFSLLRNTSVITELNRFATKMSDELKGAVKRVNKVAMRAAEANEALAEAVRRAREDAAGRRCLPLYQQLFNVLSGWW